MNNSPSFYYINVGGNRYRVAAPGSAANYEYNPNNILSATQIEDGLKRNKLTQEEMQRVQQIEITPDMSAADRELIEKYNNYALYRNAQMRSRYEAEANVQASNGPIGSEQPIKTITEERLADIDYARPVVAAGRGELYNFFNGKTSLDNTSQQTFLFTDEGIIPLSEGAQKLVQQYAGVDGQPSDFFFGVEGDREAYETVGNGRLANVPIFNQYPGKDSSLPRGAVIGIPEGEDPKSYIPIGRIASEQGRMGKGDQYVYVKVLDRPSTTVNRAVPNGDPVPIYPSMPEEPNYLEVIELPTPSEEAMITEKVNPTIEEQSSNKLPSNDPIQKEKVEGNLVVQEDSIPEKNVDPLFGSNLLANIAKGLQGWNLQGANIGVPSYDQPRYSSPESGPAVQNLTKEGT